MRRIYLDYNASTPLRPEAHDAMLEAMGGANPNSPHAEGKWARQRVERARAQVARRVGARPSQVTFTSGGTEAIQRVFRFVQGHVVVSNVEHPAVLEAASNANTDVRIVPVDELVSAVCPDTALVACMAVNNETGDVFDTNAIAASIRQKCGAKILVDAVQTRGRLDFADSGADFMVLSSSKLGGPRGVGALIGGRQTHAYGTPNVVGIAGVGAACACPPAELAGRHERLRDGLLALGGVQNGGGALGTINMRFAADADGVLVELDARGVSASSGAACTTKNKEPSHVLLARGLTRLEISRSIRFSFGWATTEADIDDALAHLAAVLDAAGG